MSDLFQLQPEPAGADSGGPDAAQLNAWEEKKRKAREFMAEAKVGFQPWMESTFWFGRVGCDACRKLGRAAPCFHMGDKCHKTSGCGCIGCFFERMERHTTWLDRLKFINILPAQEWPKLLGRSPPGNKVP
jgi:hypothetical protein